MITSGQFDFLLLKRFSGYMAKSGMDVTTVDGTNPDLLDAKAKAVRQCGGSLASPVVVADTDCATVADADLDKLLDLGRYFQLENIMEQFVQYSSTISMASQSKDQIRKGIEFELERMRDYVQHRYGWGYLEQDAIVGPTIHSRPVAGRVERVDPETGVIVGPTNGRPISPDLPWGFAPFGEQTGLP